MSRLYTFYEELALPIRQGVPPGSTIIGRYKSIDINADRINMINLTNLVQSIDLAERDNSYRGERATDLDGDNNKIRTQQTKGPTFTD